MMVFEQILDPIMSPLLNLPPLLAVAIVSFSLSVMITFIYKLTTNQDLMKQLKSEMKEFQKEMKELKEHPEEMMKVQRKAMETNMKYMVQSFKSTIFTILPVIIIFSWMNANLAYEPIDPAEQFEVELKFDKEAQGVVSMMPPTGITVIDNQTQQIRESKAIFTLKGRAGRYIEDNALRFEYNDKIFYKDIIITEEQEYTDKEEGIKNNQLDSISIDYEKKAILPILGWGWLGTYIIFSIIFSMILRKALKVY